MEVDDIGGVEVKFKVGGERELFLSHICRPQTGLKTRIFIQVFSRASWVEIGFNVGFRMLL